MATPRSASSSDARDPAGARGHESAPNPPIAAHHAAGTVHLLDYLPELAADLGQEDTGAARRALRLPAIALSSGRCEMTAVETDPRVAGTPFGLVVIEGLLLREVTLAGRTSTSLYGPAEMLDLRCDSGSPLMAAGAVVCPEEAIAAILDDRVLATMRRWPHIIARLFALTMRQLERSDIRTAVGKLERVEDRLLAFFWLMAERYGRRGPGGASIGLPLTHEAIGRLIGARRSTVSLGLRSLYEDGMLTRLEDGSWLLAPQSLQLVTREDPIAIDVSQADETDADERPAAPV